MIAAIVGNLKGQKGVLPAEAQVKAALQSADGKK